MSTVNFITCTVLNNSDDQRTFYNGLPRSRTYTILPRAERAGCEISEHTASRIDADKSGKDLVITARSAPAPWTPPETRTQAAASTPVPAQPTPKPQANAPAQVAAPKQK
jgi:hypothetical protein